jgi:uracil-DNA glycosylase family 4
MKNQIPTKPNRFRLAIIGEGPTEKDIHVGKPFADSIYLRGIVSSLGLTMDQLFLGYVSNQKRRFPQSINSDSVQAGIARLAGDLQTYRPNCCLLLGSLVNKVFGEDRSLYKTRGSIFNSPTFRTKCVATYDPAEVMRNWEWNGVFKFDTYRAQQQSLTAGVLLPKRTVESWPTFERCVALLEGILRDKPRIAFDLEGWPNAQGVTCYSIATSPSNAFIVPLRNMDNTPFWSFDQECEIWRLTGLILGDPDVRKIAQNAMYELFVFAWRHKILVRGLEDDTMFKMWEWQCEYPKGLDFISSVFTEMPYYKDERIIQDLSIHHDYCCKDSLVTHEACTGLDEALSHEPSKQHYRFNIRLLKPYLYIQLRGCKLDLALLAHKKSQCWSRIQHQQAIVNDMCGELLNVKSPKQKAKYLYDTLGLPVQYKMDAGVKKQTTDMGALAKLIVSHGTPVVLEIAKLVRLRTRFSDLHKLEPFPDGRIRSNFNPVGTDTGRLSSRETSVESIVSHGKIDFKRRKSGTVMLLTYKQQVEFLGTNLQNVTKDLRDLFIPESEDFSFFQYDLAGADAWTVAADLAALGNSKMLDHLYAGIKPSVVILLLNEYGNAVYQWDLPQLKQVHDAKLKALKAKDCPGSLKNMYSGSKAAQHGTNYGMKPPLMSATLLMRELSGWIDKFNDGYDEGDLDLKVTKPHVMERLQNFYTDYYGLELRNEYIRKQLANFGYIDCANGHRRHFTAIRSRKLIDDAIVRTAAAHEPQANTTYSTNRALENLYYDLKNRTPRGNLRVEPNLMIHDALGGQAHKSQVEWGTAKMQQWFNIPLIIHGIEITIPVEGGWGPNWKSTD